MAVALVGSGTQVENASAATSLAVPYPAGISAGHVLVLFFSVNSGTVQTAPAGWTTVFNGSSTTSTLTPSLYVGIKVAVGGESGTLAVATTNNISLGGMQAWSGVDTTTPQDVTASVIDQTTAGTANTNTSLTTGGTGRALIFVGAQNSTASTATPPSVPAAFTETADRSASTRAATMAYLIWSGSGATGTVTCTWSGSARSLGVLLALRPTVTSVFGRVHYLASTAPAAAGTPPPVADEYRGFAGLWQPVTEYRGVAGGWG